MKGEGVRFSSSREGMSPYQGSFWTDLGHNALTAAPET
ncbi:hypothetical protein JCM19237_3797 [Photobacterium aphoticum]|uniref:Uncharacterized protein n=1 Tax=Photobacterium aphoticum TaxID=754436 RepID=A0A090QUZ5_9GAMM|nr:hypothetical protein JCM19237_3797 [Photobacterium aphoticum]